MEAVEMSVVAESGTGGSGTVVTLIMEDTDIPLAFIAFIVRVYVVLETNPVTARGEAVEVVVAPAGKLLSLYPVITPAFVGATKAMDEEVVLDSATTSEVGARGTPIVLSRDAHSERSVAMCMPCDLSLDARFRFIAAHRMAARERSI